MARRRRLSASTQDAFGPLVWVILGVVVFGFLYAVSTPPKDDSAPTAGIDGVTSYFATPEAAVAKINDFLAARDWVRLSRYYDLSASKVTPGDIASGAYFSGALAVPPEPARERPFPLGYRFAGSEPTEVSDIIRVVTVPPTDSPVADENAPEASFLLQRTAEGYRLIPPDAIQRIATATPSAP